MGAGTTWLDDAIGWAFPAWGMRRAQARLARSVVLDRVRSYEGAAMGRRTSGWQTTQAGPNAALSPALDRLRARSRDLVRNCSWAGKAKQVLVGDIVGPGIIPKPRSGGVRDRRRAKEAWAEHCETPDIDPEGRTSIYGLMGQAVGELVEAGECLARRRWRRTSDGLRLPYQIQLLEPEHLDTLRDEERRNGGRIIQGIEFDSLGRRVAYWLHADHPGETIVRPRASTRVPAQDVMHLMRSDRVGQVRGIPWATPCMIRLRDWDEYTDSQLLRQKLAACFTAFVQDPSADHESKLPDGANPISERLQPGAIEWLPAGREIVFPQPPHVVGFEEFSRITLREVAAAYGVTYEALTGDLRGVNFSSGRMGWIQYHRMLGACLSHTVIPQMCGTFWRWCMEAMLIAGELKETLPASWTPPRREMLDPVKEGNATVRDLKAGLTTLRRALRERAVDPDEHLEELEEEREDLVNRGIQLDFLPEEEPDPEEGDEGEAGREDAGSESPT